MKNFIVRSTVISSIMMFWYSCAMPSIEGTISKIDSIAHNVIEKMNSVEKTANEFIGMIYPSKGKGSPVTPLSAADIVKMPEFTTVMTDMMKNPKFNRYLPAIKKDPSLLLRPEVTEMLPKHMQTPEIIALLPDIVKTPEFIKLAAAAPVVEQSFWNTAWDWLTTW